MFFNTKRSPRKTTHQTLSTEQLEQKAMFSVSPVEPVVALDVGPVNQTGYEIQAKDVASVKTHCTGYCFADTDGFMKIGDIKGEGVRNPVTMFRSIPCFPEFFEVAEGEDGRVIVHPQFNVGTTAGPGGTTFMTGEDGRSIVHPSFNVGLEGYIAATEDANEASFNVGNNGRSIVHPSFNVGRDGLAQANQQPSLTAIRDVDIASESVLGSASPGGDDVFMPKPNRTDVWTNGSATSLAPRHAAFAMMGR